jgi:phosphate transport system permease protein
VKFDRATRRKLFSHGMTVLTGLTILVILIPLAAIIYYCVTLGGPVFNLALFTQGTPSPCTTGTCQQGGINWGIQGTLVLVGVASLISVPLGVGAAFFAVEYGGQRPIARVIGTAADILAGVPSIVAGVFVYLIILEYDPLIAQSAISGGLSLSIIMVPIVTRATEEALRAVPISVREAALALGISRWKTSVRIILVSALPGVLTGVLLALARATGEAAPLLITDGLGTYGYKGLDQPVAVVSLQMFLFADSPYQNWISLAWGAALFLLLLILGLSLLSRYVLNRMVRRMRGE